jgi:hypothetical protein
MPAKILSVLICRLLNAARRLGKIRLQKRARCQPDARRPCPHEPTDNQKQPGHSETEITAWRQFWENITGV